MIGGCGFVAGREEDHLARFAVDEVNSPRKVIAYGPAAVRRTANVPETAAARRLALDPHFACA